MSEEAPATDPNKRTNLGRGLAALFGEESEDYAELDKVRSAKTVAIEQIHPNKAQPRRHFDEQALRALADSIAANGIVQPLVVRRHPGIPAEFEIVAGERRWRAAQLAQLHEVPVVIRELSDSQALEVALVENVQRQDLSAIEEAEGYRRLIEEFRHTQDQLARIVGKSRSHIANTLRLLSLPDAVKEMIDRGELSPGHARPLIGREDAEALARKIVARGLSVRQAERLVQGARGRAAAMSGTDRTPDPGPGAKDADTLALERDLTALLGLKVSIDFHGTGGSLTIHYNTLEQLDDVLRRLNQAPPPGAA
ncbi:MAG: ParB/RepB/Spo0J family partition protein [Alphaproteobacteria bacterium]|nr:MAG: ParB/RepB/Spo0J family partition protein [Alphaproteobacteria bacterium]